MSVRKREDHAGAQIRLDVLVVHRRLLLVVDEDHDHVGDLGGLGRGHDGQPGRLGLLPALAALVQRDNHVAAGIAQVERVRVSLRAVADDGNLFAHQIFEVAILRVKHLCHCIFPPCPSFPFVFGFVVWIRRFSQIYLNSSLRRRVRARPRRCEPAPVCRNPPAAASSR